MEEQPNAGNLAPTASADPLFSQITLQFPFVPSITFFSHQPVTPTRIVNSNEANRQQGLEWQLIGNRYLVKTSNNTIFLSIQESSPYALATFQDTLKKNGVLLSEAKQDDVYCLQINQNEKDRVIEALDRLSTVRLSDYTLPPEPLLLAQHLRNINFTPAPGM
jgi:hypothetical protein